MSSTVKFSVSYFQEGREFQTYIACDSFRSPNVVSLTMCFYIVTQSFIMQLLSTEKYLRTWNGRSPNTEWILNAAAKGSTFTNVWICREDPIYLTDYAVIGNESSLFQILLMRLEWHLTYIFPLPEWNANLRVCNDQCLQPIRSLITLLESSIL